MVSSLTGVRESHASDRPELTIPVRRLIALAPFAIVVLYSAFLAVPTTRGIAATMLEENQPVEMLTFIFFLWAGLHGTLLAWRARRRGEDALTALFYLLFSVGLLLLAGEEIAWGQWFFHFETPPMFREMNAQGETTLHNLKGLQGSGDLLRLIFGVGGLLGIWLGRFEVFKKIAVPVILLPWFVVIVGHSVLDLYNDFASINRPIDRLVEYLDELIELLIATAALLYVWLQARMLSPRPESSP